MKVPLTFKFSDTPIEAPPTTQESEVLIITAGREPGFSQSNPSEIYPASNSCTPSLPSVRGYMGFHSATFLTSEPNPVVASCGCADPRKLYSCKCGVLDLSNQSWEEDRMGRLTVARIRAAVARLNYVGVYVIGGTENTKTSDYLAAGSMEWQEGPALPVDMYRPCAIDITSTSYLAIYGSHILEFDAAIDGPTSSKGWMEANRWPSLNAIRYYTPGCAKIGQKVVIAGGYNDDSLSSTEVLDLSTRTISMGGNMATPRYAFHLATVVISGQERLFALGGYVGAWYYGLNSAEEWVEENSSWKSADSFAVGRDRFGVVAVPRRLVCAV